MSLTKLFPIPTPGKYTKLHLLHINLTTSTWWSAYISVISKVSSQSARGCKINISSDVSCFVQRSRGIECMCMNIFNKSNCVLCERSSIWTESENKGKDCERMFRTDHTNVWTLVKLVQIMPRNKLWFSSLFLLLYDSHNSERDVVIKSQCIWKCSKQNSDVSRNCWL